MSRLQEYYLEKAIPELRTKLNIKNSERVPRIQKIIINVGSGEINTNKGFLESVQTDLERITGQKPVVTKARKAISAFKIRENNPIGMKVTLRGKHMYDFLDKLISVTAPRVRDFRGFKRNAFDGQGNYSIGFKEHTVFIEIPYESVNRVHGLQVVITTTAQSDDEGRALLESLHFPFQKAEGVANGA